MEADNDEGKRKKEEVCKGKEDEKWNYSNRW